MNFTLGFFASVCILLPGLVAVAAFNQKSGLAGVRRLEQPLTSVRTLVTAICLSLAVHFLAFIVVELGLALVIDIASRRDALDIGPAIDNPITALVEVVTKGIPMGGGTVFALAVVSVLEVFAIVGFISRDPFDLLVEPFDLGGHGWLFQHVVRPAENGYMPIGHVFTKPHSDGYALAYLGLIVDIRHGPDGSVLSVALSRPERFIYRLGEDATPPVPAWRVNEDEEPVRSSAYRSFDRELVGGVVAISGEQIANISVHNVEKMLIDEVAGEDEAEE
ncbi:hypothetical protein D0Y83_00145 [Qipengyuania flava]|uniref:Uncharacterized protein n=1 Tax=Qipengyuania flava TaxID=192812 RepID=A0A5P6N7A0_9SPHN|nr:hypothetical protein [Qipengyuania flava]MAO80783.1 hypothetical protein [Nocardioides sp.]QFI61865.1 hypothetical protein D0Y83_00145 [Qipengyuania flava]